MNDRFKFRGIHPVLGELQEINFIDFIHNTVDFGDGDIFNIENIEDAKIQQATGLKDKNGKLIYEGDVVRYTEYEIDDIEPEWEQAEVVWGNDYDNYYPAFDLKDKDFDGTNAFAYLFNEGWTIEVIGNKFENPELLKECE